MMRSVLILSLFAPYMFLAIYSGGLVAPHWDQTLHALLVSSRQALLSSLVAMLLGMGGAMGLLALPSGMRIWGQAVCLLPSFLPSLFIILSLLNLALAFGDYPIGLPGVVLAHALIYSGLVAMGLSAAISQSQGRQLALARLMGASRRRIFSSLLPRSIWSEALRLMILVFAACFTSLSVPMVLGGDSGQSLEWMIIQNLNGEPGLAGALGLALIQSVFIFALAFMLPVQRPSQSSEEEVRWLGISWLMIIPIFVALISLSGLVKGLELGALQWMEYWDRTEEFLYALSGSMILGVLSGAFALIFLLSLSYQISDSWLLKVYAGYLAPSSALVGLSLLLAPGSGEMWAILKASLGLSLVFVPVLFRWRGQAVLEQIRGSVDLARMMGAGRWEVFRQIVWPQVVRDYCQLAGICGFWAIGDFAISSILFTRDSTAALWIKTLVAFYRVEMAAVAIWPLLAVAILCYLFWRSFSHVIGPKSVS